MININLPGLKVRKVGSWWVINIGRLVIRGIGTSAIQVSKV